MRQYLDLLREIHRHGAPKGDRTGTGTLSLFGHQMRFDLAQGFPLVTTKKIHVRSVVLELLWFLRGDTNVAWLHEHGVTIWDEWADASGELEAMALMPCHALFQFHVAGGRLSCQLYQRSADFFLGVPFNIASYALLTHMLAQQCDLAPGEFVWTGGDCHLYVNHFEQADEQLAREPYPLATLKMRRRPPSLFDYTYEDFEFVSYRHHQAIKAPVAV